MAGLPRKRKNMNLFNEGLSYLGEVASVTLPVLTRATEPWRGGGMNAPVKADMGMEGLEMEWTIGGLDNTALRQWGVTSVDGVLLRFAGAYQRETTGAVDAVEVVVRGRHEEIDMGEQKPGEDTEQKVKTAVAYYKLTMNGFVEIEIDILNMIERVGGVDRLAAQRAAIGV